MGEIITALCYINGSVITGAYGIKYNRAPEKVIRIKYGMSYEELETLQAQAVSLGLCARIIHDAGRTQIAAGSATVLGVLGPKSVVDQVTGQLKLL